MSKQLKALLVYSLGFLFVVPVAYSVFAATLQFDPTTVSTQTGQTFEVKVNVAAGSEQIRSTDIYVNYDQTVLSVQQVSDGTFFPSVVKSYETKGQAYIAGLVTDAATSKTGTGTVATITFKALKNGTATLTFSCSAGSNTSSHILKNDINATDIIECSSNGRSVVTVGNGGIVNTPTPTQASSNGVTATPTTVSQLPQSGIAENIPVYAGLGMVLFLLGMGVRMLL